jgi:hypothetical protein
MSTNTSDQIIVRNWEPSAADPARLVGASCASTLWATLEKSKAENWENSVNVPLGKNRAELSQERTCRDYAPKAVMFGQEIVRPAWQHAEASRNDSPAVRNSVTTGQFQIRRFARSTGCEFASALPSREDGSVDFLSPSVKRIQ